MMPSAALVGALAIASLAMWCTTYSDYRAGRDINWFLTLVPLVWWAVIIAQALGWLR